MIKFYKIFYFAPKASKPKRNGGGKKLRLIGLKDDVKRKDKEVLKDQRNVGINLFKLRGFKFNSTDLFINILNKNM